MKNGYNPVFHPKLEEIEKIRFPFIYLKLEKHIVQYQLFTYPIYCTDNVNLFPKIENKIKYISVNC